MQMQDPKFSEFRRMLVFFTVVMLVFMLWEYWFPKPQQPVGEVVGQVPVEEAVQSGGTDWRAAVPIRVATDTVEALIDEKSGDLRGLTLLKHNATGDASQRFVLLAADENHQYLAQSMLLDAQGRYLLKDRAFTASQTVADGKTEVRLRAPETDGIQVDKVYTFRNGSYLVDVRFDIHNNSTAPVRLDAVYRLLRDGSQPEGAGFFDQTYTGPVVYTDEGKFQKVDFESLDKDFANRSDRAEYQRSSVDGWIGFTQHYFSSVWILQPKDGESICRNGACLLDVKRRSDHLYSAGVRVPLPEIAPGEAYSVQTGLYAGPQEYSVMVKTADNLELIKDYGRTHLFASPLFSLLNVLHGWVGNWGWAIVLLTIIVKIVLLPLTNASYRSMARMRAVAPKLEMLKKEHGNDRMALQQAMMKLYRDEKINPLGGCLPMLLQIPVFIGLFWVLFASVELRQASWWWVDDLARTDPLFVLPVLMTVTMYVQTLLNPPPSDPLQAKMMKMMPLLFSVMFFFFPAGLVLYYVVNNLLTIAQQWWANKRYSQAK